MKIPFVKMWAEGASRTATHFRATGAGRYAWLVLAAALIAHIGIGFGGSGIWSHDALNYDDPQVLAAVEESSLAEILTEPTYLAYKPIYFLSLKLDAALGGLLGAGGVVAVAHVVNWLLHALVAFLLLFLLAHIFGKPWLAFAAAILFAVHPVHVESVAWLSERKDVLSLLLALWAHTSYRLRREEGRGRAIVPAIWLLLAGLTKGTVWAYAGVIAVDELLYRGAEQGRRVRGALVATAPLLLVALGGIILDFAVGRAAGPGSVSHDASTGELVAAMAGVHTAYLQHVLVPVGLALDYAVDPAGSFSDPLAWVGILLALGAIVGLVVSIRRRSLVGAFAAALWIFGLAAVNNIFPRTSVLMADRYLYMPAIGVYLLAAVLLARLGARRNYALGALVVLLGVLSAMRTGAFASSELVWSDTIDKVPTSALAHIQRGQDRARRGATKDAGIGLFRDALADADAAIDIKPRVELMVRARLVRCAAYLGLGETRQLRFESQTLLEVLDTLPPDQEPEDVRGIRAEAWIFRGQAFEAQGYEIAALEAYEAAVEHDPDSGIAHYNYATALARLGDRASLAEALRHLERALPLLEGEATIHKRAMIQLAAVQGRLGNAKAALQTLLEAGRRYVRDADVYYAEARVRLGTGEIAQAKELLNTIRHYEPDHAKARRLAAEILQAEGEVLLRRYRDTRGTDAENVREMLRRAIHKFDEAVKADAGFWEGHVSAGDALMESGLFGEARDRYRRALSTNDRLDWVRSLVARTHVIEAAWLDMRAGKNDDTEVAAALRSRAASIMAGGLRVGARRVDFGFTPLEEEQRILLDVAEVYEDATGSTRLFGAAILRGAAHLCAGDADAAYDAVTFAADGLTDAPGHARLQHGVLLLRAMVAQRRTRIAEARRDYETLAERRPDDALPQLRVRHLNLQVANARLSTALGYRQDLDGLARARTAQGKALTALITFADKTPGSVAAGLAAAEAEMARDQWIAALRRLNRLAERFPDHPSVYRGRSTVYLRQRVQTREQILIRELTQSADKELRKAISLDPRDVRVFLDAANLAQSAQDIGQAIKHARRARELEAYPGGPGSRKLAILLSALARNAIEAREIKRARGLIDEARRVDAHGSTPWLLEAELALATPAQDKLTRAMELARKAKELDPYNPEVNQLLARVYQEQGVVAVTRLGLARVPPNPMAGPNGKIDDASKAEWAQKSREEQGRLIKAWEVAKTAAQAQRDALRRDAIMMLETSLTLDPEGERADATRKRLASLRRSDPVRQENAQRRAFHVLYKEAMDARRDGRPKAAYDKLLDAITLDPRLQKAHLRIAETVCLHLLPRYQWEVEEDRRQIDSFVGGAFLSVHALDKLDSAGLMLERHYYRGLLNKYLYDHGSGAETRAAAKDNLARYVDAIDRWIANESEKPAERRRQVLIDARAGYRTHAATALRKLK